MSRNNARTFGVALILISFAIAGASPSVKALGPAQQLSLTPASLALSIIPPKLPADGNTYPALLVSVVDKNGQPTAALTSIQAFLTDSRQNVGTVSESVTIPGGQTYAVANFTTTNTPGSTSVTATAPGLASASTVVNTVIAVGYPTRLVLTAVPNKVLSSASTGKLFLELEDDVGLPAKAIAAEPISLFSSNTHVANVTSPTITMGQGEYLNEVGYSSGFIAGSAVITASASGFASGVATVTVLGSPLLAVKLFALPATIAVCSSKVTACMGRLTVALTDLGGNPARAPQAITVQIRSSNFAIVQANQSIVIQAGQISAYANYSATSTPGIATVTASALGLQSGFASIKTTSASVASPAICKNPPPGQQTTCALQILTGPNPVLADHRSYDSVVVALKNSTGSPMINFTGTTFITLTSSVPGVGIFNSITLAIPPGQNWAPATFTSTFQVGTTQLTASSQNFISAQAALATFGPVPSKVVLKPISSVLPADGASHPAIELDLEDSLGSPAPAPPNFSVNVTSSQNSIVSISPTIIPVGQTFAVLNVTTGVLQGTANVTALESAFSTGYAASSALFTTVIPAPSSLASFIPNGNKLIWPASTSQQAPLVAVQLQDAAGNPARARAPMNITVTSANSTVIPKILTIAVAIGQDYVLLPISPAVPGSTILTISAPGLSISSLPVTFLAYPSQEGISGGPLKILQNQSSIISVSITLDGAPLQGASVQWSTSSGGLIVATPPATNQSSTSTVASPAIATSSTRSAPQALPAGSPSLTDSTDKTGTSVVIFRPNRAGLAKISAGVSGPGISTKTFNFTVEVTAPPPAVTKPGPSLTQEITSFPLVLLPIAGAGGVIAAIVLIRRRGGKGGGDENFDTSFE